MIRRVLGIACAVLAAFGRSGPCGGIVVHAGIGGIGGVPRPEPPVVAPCALVRGPRDIDGTLLARAVGHPDARGRSRIERLIQGIGLSL